ncbi:hypothetical protein [Limnoglobus roseus]|uniref:Uncharacterized protein n=1 Tax=Limnoglobus roseus TaxID=2598579 RepID=A0A5C1AKT6_9BACT|nr:hypothetical protein [Limnoglobus roseus]QEL18777.1 hypothetical protein PX52LOC_05816 [Limnoglobus roseus]
MSEEQQPSILQQFAAKRAEWAAEQPSLGAELKAMAREAVKDVRQTLNESYFGQGEHAPEMGTPLNPTPYETTQDREASHGSFQDLLQNYSARGRGAEEQNKEMDR